MSKYISNGVRVVAINDKSIVPDGEAVELTAGEIKHPYIQELIKAGELVEVESNKDDDQASDSETSNDQSTGDSDAGQTTTKKPTTK